MFYNHHFDYHNEQIKSSIALNMCIALAQCAMRSASFSLRVLHHQSCQAQSEYHGQPLTGGREKN